MANSTLDFSHPFFQRAIKRNKDDPRFNDALDAMKQLIEANHEACHRVVQDGMGRKYPQCHGKIWKYDWQPPGTQSLGGRKSWRLVGIVPDPTTQPYYIIAAAIYPKSTTDQLSSKQLAAIFAAVTIPQQPQADEPEPMFTRVSNGDGRRRSLCIGCGETVSIAAIDEELQTGEDQHTCPLETG